MMKGLELAKEEGLIEWIIFLGKHSEISIDIL